MAERKLDQPLTSLAGMYSCYQIGSKEAHLVHVDNLADWMEEFAGPAIIVPLVVSETPTARA